MKFDLIIGNPPYQNSSGSRKGGVRSSSILWDKFVFLSIELANNYVSLVHPALWRKPENKLFNILRDNLIYLEIHSSKDGIKTFSAETRYDWYVYSKTYNGKTIVKFEDEIIELNLNDYKLIPNAKFNLVNKLIAKNENNVKVLKNSHYHTLRDHVVNYKDEEYKYPIVYYIKKNNICVFKYSNRNDKHFGIPKLIYSTGRPTSAGFLLDLNGDYGITQFCSAIIDSKENLIQMKKALDSMKFRDFCHSIHLGKLEINTKIIKLFKKDFWREFL
jgi:uncharacterized protein YdcH (DUF465 family)